MNILYELDLKTNENDVQKVKNEEGKLFSRGSLEKLVLYEKNVNAHMGVPNLVSILFRYWI